MHGVTGGDILWGAIQTGLLISDEDENIYQTVSSPTNAHVEFIKTKLKLRRLLQHVSVYKETIIREPVSA